MKKTFSIGGVHPADKKISALLTKRFLRGAG